ncbi:MAG: murein biosynthesis integral membrane protein MurJ [Actinomycetes bacterium]
MKTLTTETNQTQAVLRNSALMATGTVASRITGVARDICIAAALGSALLADTYALGNSLPNIIYILVVGGALNAIFIPQLIRHMKNDADGGDGYADRLLTLVAIVLVAVAVLAVALAPFIVDLYASAELQNPQHAQDLALAVAFARFCLPQIIFYGLYTMFSQVLNARLHFGAPMFAPIVNNLVMISTALLFMWVVGTTVTSATISSGQVALLGIGTTVGVAAQALVLLPVLHRVGYHWRPRFDFRGHGLGKAGSLAGWTIGLVFINQLGFIVIARLATGANVIASLTGGTAQGLALYQRAFLVFMLPHSVITISLVTALLPRMSKSAAHGRLPEVARDVGGGMRLIGALIIPCALFLMAFGPLVGTIFFGFGQNAGAPATYTGLVVSVFAIGMLPFSLFYILLRGWYSVEDTRTPFLVTVLYNVVAIPLTIALYAAAPDAYKVCALALGYGLGYWVTLVVTWILLRRRLGSLQSGTTITTLLRILVAAGVATALGAGLAFGGFALIKGVSLPEAYNLATGTVLTSLLVALVGGVLTLGVYGLLAHVMRISELTEIAGLISSKIRR